MNARMIQMDGRVAGPRLEARARFSAGDDITSPTHLFRSVNCYVGKPTMKRIVLFAMVLLVCGCGKTEPQGEQLKLPLPFMDMVDINLATVLQAPKGTVATRSGLNGKIVVLEFWATWCGPCRPALLHLNKVAEECKDDPIQFIAITFEDESVVRDFLQETPMKGWVGIDQPSDIPKIGRTAKAHGVVAIPHTVVLDQHGFVVAQTHPSLISRDGLLNIMKERPWPPRGQEKTQPSPAPDG